MTTSNTCRTLRDPVGTSASDAILERVGLTHALDRPIGCFSKGMTQRIGLAQALLHDPELLILDEPMSGLDPIGRKQVRDLICSCATAGSRARRKPRIRRVQSTESNGSVL